MIFYFLILNFVLCHCIYLSELFDYEKEFNKNITEYFMAVVKKNHNNFIIGNIFTKNNYDFGKNVTVIVSQTPVWPYHYYLKITDRHIWEQM